MKKISQRDHIDTIYPSALKKEHWKEITKKTKKCPYCPPHDNENYGRRQRTDKYKNIPRDTIRKLVEE